MLRTHPHRPLAIISAQVVLTKKLKKGKFIIQLNMVH